MSQLEKVRNFYVKFGFDYKGPPRALLDSEQNFRVKCMREELMEYEYSILNSNKTEQLDALVDLVYFILGTAVRNGFDFDTAFDRVHQCNMQKTLSLKESPNSFAIEKPEGWKSAELQDLVSEKTSQTIYKQDIAQDLKGLIVVEGADGTGKTTLAKRIAYLTGGEYIHFDWTPTLNPVMDMYVYNGMQYAGWLSTDRVVVVDRAWLSGVIYSNVYRPGEMQAFEPIVETMNDFEAIEVIGLGGEGWIEKYMCLCETRNECYSNVNHQKMEDVNNLFAQYSVGKEISTPVGLVPKPKKPMIYVMDNRMNPNKMDRIVGTIISQLKYKGE